MFLDNSLDLYIPVPYWNISAFRQSLGHKLNHSFKRLNTKFGRAYHPRFGNTRAIVAIKDIQRGEELLVDYGYQKHGNEVRHCSCYLETSIYYVCPGDVLGPHGEKDEHADLPRSHLLPEAQAHGGRQDPLKVKQKQLQLTLDNSILYS